MRSLSEVKQKKNELMTEAMTALYFPSAKRKTTAGIAGAGFAMLSTIGTFMAANGDIFDNAKDIINNVYGKLFAVVTALAAFMILIFTIMWMVSTDPRTAAEAKQRVKQVIIAWILACCIGGIVNFVTKNTKDYNYTAGKSSSKTK